MMTPLDTLYNIGKLFMFIGGAMFIWLTILGQMTYWMRARTTPSASFRRSIGFLRRPHCGSATSLLDGSCCSSWWHCVGCFGALLQLGGEGES